MDDNKQVVQRVHQMCLVIENLGQELQDARRWAKAWKGAAKNWREQSLVFGAGWAEVHDARDAEVKRLREALEFVADVVELRDHAGRHMPANAGVIRELDEVVQAALEATE